MNLEELVQKYSSSTENQRKAIFSTIFLTAIFQRYR